MARAKPTTSAPTLRRTRDESRPIRPNARLRMAPYSGPTTIAPTMRICEFVTIPMAPMSPAMTSRPNQLGGKLPSRAIRPSTSAQTGVNCWYRPRLAATRSACAEIEVSTFSMTMEPRWSTPRPRSRSMTSLAAPCRTSKCTASPSGWLTASGSIVRLSTPGSERSMGITAGRDVRRADHSQMDHCVRPRSLMPCGPGGGRRPAGRWPSRSAPGSPPRCSGRSWCPPRRGCPVRGPCS